MNKYIKIILFSSIILLSGCLESSFTLDEGSRIPYFLKVPKDYARSDFYVTLDYYSTFTGTGSEAVFKLYKNDSYFCLDKVSVQIDVKDHMLELKNTSSAGPLKGYPSYEIFRVKGVVDVIEHRKMEPIFYTVDNTLIWQELGVKH